MLSRPAGPQARQRLGRLITGKNPPRLHFPSALWTRSMTPELIWREFGVSLGEYAAGSMLRRLGPSPQRPLFRACQQDPDAVRRWRAQTYPATQRLAGQEDALTCFADEAGGCSDHPGGTTWAHQGRAPLGSSSGGRFGKPPISAVSAHGWLRFMAAPQHMTATVFAEFRRRLLRDRKRPVFVIVDNRSIHRARKLEDFVEQTKGRPRPFRLRPQSPRTRMSGSGGTREEPPGGTSGRPRSRPVPGDRSQRATTARGLFCAPRLRCTP